MSGKLIHRGPIIHVCHPGCILEPLGESELHLPPETIMIRDKTSDYRNGDIWECDDCKRRWTLNWSGPIEGKNWMRIMPNSSDWVPESKRKWRKRINE